MGALSPFRIFDHRIPPPRFLPQIGSGIAIKRNRRANKALICLLLIDALEMMKQGAQRLLVRKSVAWRGVSKRFSILYGGKWLKNSDSFSTISPTNFNESSNYLLTSKEDGYCCLSREDIVRFIIGFLGAIAPIPLSSISSLSAVNDHYCFIEASSPALQILHNFPQNPSAAAVVEIAADGARKIIGEISAYKLWKCDYVAAARAMANLSAGQFVMGSEDEDQESPPDFFLTSQMENGIAKSPRPRIFSSRSIGFFGQQLVGGLRSTRSMYRGRSAPLTCRHTSSLAAVMAQMLSNRAAHVWVTEDGPEENTLVGVVGYNDILNAVTNYRATVSPAMS
ncbi:CBS domain-containing protein CBSX6 [Platanthera guangdongensis]|uniref:CBS domain-containing protein CBSX6 n=1 Tax=Platanthera guangdongensis TaxID=2320717 RepID=A0ABR2MES8_9ASPA